MRDPTRTILGDSDVMSEEVEEVQCESARRPTRSEEEEAEQDQDIGHRKKDMNFSNINTRASKSTRSGVVKSFL